MKGEKNNVPTKHRAVTTAVRPVRPPACTPVADSMNAPEVEVPTTAANIIDRASAIIGRDLRKIAILVQEPRTRRDTDERSHCVHESHDENREHNREKAP